MRRQIYGQTNLLGEYSGGNLPCSSALPILFRPRNEITLSYLEEELGINSMWWRFVVFHGGVFLCEPR